MAENAARENTRTRISRVNVRKVTGIIESRHGELDGGSRREWDCGVEPYMLLRHVTADHIGL